MKWKNNFYEYIKKLFVNPTARVPWLMLGGILMNCIYIATNVASAVIYHNLWAGILTVYHLVLIIIRLYLFFSSRFGVDDYAGGRLCFRVGVLLLFLDIASALIMFFSFRHTNYVSYSGLILLGFLVFTIYSVTRSVIDLKKYRQSENHLYFTARNISLATSLMSVFNLQYSVFSLLRAEFLLTGRVTFLCGAVIFSIVFYLSVRLMRRGSKI